MSSRRIACNFSYYLSPLSWLFCTKTVCVFKFYMCLFLPLGKLREILRSALDSLATMAGLIDSLFVVEMDKIRLATQLPNLSWQKQLVSLYSAVYTNCGVIRGPFHKRFRVGVDASPRQNLMAWTNFNFIT